MNDNKFSFVVTNILSQTKLIMSGGKDKGVQVKDRFGILDSESTEIINPLTGELLDSITRYKDILLVTEVRDKYSILSTFDDDDKQSQISLINNMQFSVFGAYDNTLNVKEDDIDDVLSKISDNVIAVGDIMEKIS
ncbi:hypothetical protein [Weissella confusa]|uniref:hypothetical protein n=1 Tax=Weissella confusa TaxID=1583 RepID=UPI00376EBCF3